MKLLAVLCGGGLIVASGIIHGMITDRWTDPEDLEKAAQNFQHFPLEVGPWKGEVQDNNTTKASGLAASVAVRYQHQKNGKKVTVFLGCGRPGPVSIHTPDVCYAASGFAVEAQSTESFGPPSPEGGKSGKMFTARFKKSRGGEQTLLRIYWTWHAGGEWNVTDNPRFQFFHQKVLHKLYVLHEMENPNDPPDPEVCSDLLPRLTQAIEDKVISPRP
jgi:hypothetical protein